MKKIKVLFAGVIIMMQISVVLPYKEMHCFATEIEMEEPTSIEVEELDLGDYSNTMMVGEKQLLNVTILPYEVGETKISYISENEKIASVNGVGRITAVSVGTTTITATCGSVSEQFILTVKEAQLEKSDVIDIEISNFENTLEVGKSMTISAVIVPSEISDQTVTYVTETPEIASVNQSGEIKGLSVGEAVITVKAGQVTKKLELKVKMGTSAINLNTNYLVMKKGDRFDLKTKAYPLESNQDMVFKSLDTNVVEVSSDGRITAKGIGSTMIMVSNTDMSNAVTIIVNEDDVQGTVTNTGQNVELVSDDKYSSFLRLFAEQEQVTIKAQEYDVLDSKILRYMYDNNKSVLLTGDGYELCISGKDIVNTDNELCTEIELKRENGEVSFCLNKGENLPGTVSITITDGENYPYFYMYNEALEEYNQLNVNTASNMRLDISGEYKMSQEKLSENRTVLIYIGVIGIIVVAAGGVAYVIIKKRHWFW